MPTLQISARLINWPGLCACCCHAAGTSVAATHTRVTGVKVVREDTRAWQMPYCSRCLQHIQASKELHALRSTAFNYLWLIAGGGAAVTLIVGLALGKASAVAGILVGLLLLGGTVAASVLAAPACRRHYEEAKRRDAQVRAEAEARLARLLHQDCAEPHGVAVAYDGWHGSVHTFQFSNDRFVEAVRVENPKKCLG